MDLKNVIVMRDKLVVMYDFQNLSFILYSVFHTILPSDFVKIMYYVLSGGNT